MENVYKEIGQAYTNYAITTGKKITEFNTKLFQDYVEFSRGLFKMVPGMENLVSAPAKK
jgi:hypothetical protein